MSAWSNCGTCGKRWDEPTGELACHTQGSHLPQNGCTLWEPSEEFLVKIQDGCRKLLLKESEERVRKAEQKEAEVRAAREPEKMLYSMKPAHGTMWARDGVIHIVTQMKYDPEKELVLLVSMYDGHSLAVCESWFDRAMFVGWVPGFGPKEE